MAIGTFDTRREAAQALGRFAASYDARPLVDRKASRQTVGEFSESWWKTRAGHRPSTRVRDRQALDRDVLPFFRDAQLGRLGRADVQQWIDELSQGLAPSTVRRTYVVPDQLLAVVVERGIIAASPTKGVQLPRSVRPEARFLTPSGLERLASAIEPRYRAMVLVMAWGTLRIGEASGLRRRDVNRDAGTIRIENNAVQVLGRPIEGPPKTRAGRRSMTLPPSVMDELGAHLDRQPGSRYVFGPSGSGRFSPTIGEHSPGDVSCSPPRCARFVRHLKHAGVALLALAGVDPLRLRAGHSSVSFTYDRYGHHCSEKSIVELRESSI